VTVSVLLRPGVAGRDWPEVPRKRWGWLPLLTGVALVEAVAEVTEITATLKWPNDLLVGDRKCGGILLDAHEDAVVIGVGLNVTLGAEELPPDPPWGVGATSLAVAGATNLDRDALLVSLLRELETWYRRWRAAGGDAEECGLRAAYLRACDTVGRRVRVLLPGGGELTGTAIMVDADGRLVVRRRDGDTRAIASGDILHVRGFSDSVA
jgi:BirA family biotin operon repressor/biotin-[acetyl-CoA-carboxylase] ligase